MYIYSYATTEGIVKKINQDALMIKIARYKDKDIYSVRARLSSMREKASTSICTG